MFFSTQLSVAFNRSHELKQLLYEVGNPGDLLIDTVYSFNHLQSIYPKDCKQCIAEMNTLRKKLCSIRYLVESTQHNSGKGLSNPYKVLMLLYKIDGICDELVLLFSQLYPICLSDKRERFELLETIVNKLKELNKERTRFRY
ncbi:hypothetical protein CRP01_40845 [Flavilitoribacter nigricans DSM 23189 = NBRC 102662]|uniref:Uncharacterized protein n=1 Tax=Flavilitoribacter nigricans (strain ATCC 23147 / DSM 23189 / NBRC 102662 / NCIMB 1420 / SS-2) TaxID=1122177 RepID=A0A2D0MWR6_FLAN2|nr:hypothetical protein CRP01_40845 [Flavilitoribacter nigricans DSM 23189 = NBRC 102662]